MKIRTTLEYGTKRTRKRFLWFPERFWIYETRPPESNSVTKCFGRSETLWLETIEVDEEWREGKCADESDWWKRIAYRRMWEASHE